MKIIRRLFDILPVMILLFMANLLVWGAVFLHITDTKPENKLVYYIDAPGISSEQLAEALEKCLVTKNGKLKMVKVRPFSYAMMGSSPQDEADVFLLAESDIGRYSGWLAELPADLCEGKETLNADDRVLGIYPEKQLWTEYIGYQPGERYVIAWCVNSVHAQTDLLVQATKLLLYD